MPRILPRLLDRLAKLPLSAKENAVDKSYLATKNKWRYRALAPRPSFTSERTSSILVERVNPITKPNAYVRQKSPAPVLRVIPNQRRVAVARNGQKRDLTPRLMSPEERSWWANPYLRMLSSPVRRCAMTERLLPSDFLIRLTPMRLPGPRGSRPALTAVPDGLEHPKYRPRRGGKGYYFLCRRAAFAQLPERQGGWRRTGASAPPPALLPAQIAHLLRLRVLQELALLARRLKARGARAHPVLRRLTRGELAARGLTSPGAAAVLVVPPVNRDPASGRRPETALARLPLEDVPHAGAKRAALPPCVMHAAAGDAAARLPHAEVPLYNGVALFPGRQQRATLHAMLNEVLRLERKARFKEEQSARNEERQRSETAPSEMGALPVKRPAAKGDNKMSHAYLVRSDAHTLFRADTVPLLIALWRVRMWEGGGWTEESTWESEMGIRPRGTEAAV